MSTITTRAGKGSPLTNNEVDANFTNLNADKAELSGAAFTGAITTNSTVDGRDVATDGSKLDGIESGATADQTAAEIKTAYESNADTNAFTDADESKLDGIEASADVTDTTNVTAAGALMDSEVTNLAQVKAFDSADYATAAQGTTADAALPRTGGAMTGAITTNSTFDGRDVAADGTKLDGIEASADVTDATNVTAAGALMDSELTSIASVKALNQGVATGDSPDFAALNVNGTATLGGLTVDGAGDVAFGTKLFWDASAESLGIGTSSPSKPLEITDTTADGTGGVKISSYLPTLEMDDISGGSTSFILQQDGTSTLFKHDTTERMRIDSSGNVEVKGGQDLRVYRGDNATYGSMKYLSGSGGLQLNDNNGDGISFVQADGAAEYMRIDSSGNLLVGTPQRKNSASRVSIKPVGSGIAFETQPSNANGYYVGIFYNNSNAMVGNIYSSPTSTSFSTSSDQRLKENIADADDAGSKIDSIQVRKYDWKADGSHQDYGMIAQELQLVAPEAVSGDADSEEMMGVDYSKLVPMLIKEIQSLRNRVATLENRE